MRAERRSEAWLRLFCKAVWRDVDLFLGSGGGFEAFLLPDAPRVGFVSLPLPRRGALRI
jgi:hypothetical protein